MAYDNSKKIGVGTTANDKKGDSLRTAFTKVNNNFEELYTKLGLLTDTSLNLGAFEFTGSTMSTTDSTSIIIDQSVTVSSNLTVGGDLLPSTANGGTLGSSTRPWRELYVSGSTIYINNVPLALDDTGNLTVDGVPVNSVGSADWSAVTNKPTFATVSTSGSYTDLTNKPSLFDGNYNSLSNRPTFAAVATSGSYNDLRDRPNLAGTYQFSVAADDSTQRLVSTNEVIKFIGAGGITTSSDAEGNITITGSNNFGYLTAEKDTIKGTAGYQYTFATDGYFTSSTSSESTNYFFVAYNATNANIAAGWTVVGGTADTTVSSVTYPVGGYPGVIRVNLTAPASSTSGFYPVTVTSPNRLSVEIQPNPGTNDKFAFTTSGLTFPDATVQNTAYTGTGNISFESGGESAGIYNNQGGQVFISNFSYITDEAETAYIRIPAGNSSAALQLVQEQGGIEINADGNIWEFSSNGALRLPAGGDILNSNGQSVLGGGGNSLTNNNDINITVNNDDSSSYRWNFGNTGVLTLPEDGDIVDSNGNTVIGVPTVTTPIEEGTVYKGLQVSYGMIHSNDDDRSELNVNKIVIHKPAITTTTIHPTSSQDDFRVDGLGNSDILAMFVVYGDRNEAKRLSTLKDFAETAIDYVILEDGISGQYNTVAQMKSAFYSNHHLLEDSANGLYTNFEFYQNNTPAISGVTTTRQGSGAVFTVYNLGNGEYGVEITGSGTNYRTGHKIKVLGTALGGTTPTNDAIITVSGTGSISNATITGVAPGSTTATFTAVTGTNHQVGSGFTVQELNFNGPNLDQIIVTSLGSNYVVGDVLTIPGTDFQNGTTPENDVTITITAITGGGVPRSSPIGWTVSGNYVRIWPTDSISDGGRDQYDTANYIDTSYADSIPYGGGNVTNGAEAFGPGSNYVVVYSPGIFGLFATGNQSTFIATDGNSGADGDSKTEAGNIYGPSTPSQTFDNALTHINLVSDAWIGPSFTFRRPDGSNATIDILIPDDGNGAGVAIARDSNGNGIFNPYREGSWNSDVSPDGIGWNIDGWDDLSNVTAREYVNLYAAFGFGGLGNKIVGTECVIYLPDNGKYYAIRFDSWTQGGNGGGFAYTRREINVNNPQEGIRFSDGTKLTSAEGVGRVKLKSPGGRRIEEVHGYKEVLVTSITTMSEQTTASRAGNSTTDIWIDTTITNIDNIIDDPSQYDYAYDFEFSLDNTIWYPYANNYSSIGIENAYGITGPSLTYSQGAAVYFRYKIGGNPVTWWDKGDLPSGGDNFRGAVIDYHAFTVDSTIIGTIHIVDDDGEDHISHQEVQSGSTDGENDDLWYVTTEGRIRYRRIDGQEKRLKIQWSARVFYGSELND